MAFVKLENLERWAVILGGALGFLSFGWQCRDSMRENREVLSIELEYLNDTLTVETYSNQKVMTDDRAQELLRRPARFGVKVTNLSERPAHVTKVLVEVGAPSSVVGARDTGWAVGHYLLFTDSKGARLIEPGDFVRFQPATGFPRDKRGGTWLVRVETTRKKHAVTRALTQRNFIFTNPRGTVMGDIAIGVAR